MKLLTKFMNDHSISQDYLDQLESYMKSRGVSVKIEEVGGPVGSDSWNTIYVWVEEDIYPQAQRVLKAWFDQ